MAIAFFRVLGGLTLYLLAGILFVSQLSNGRYSLHASQMSRFEMLRFVLLGAILLSMGLGLLFLRKWAALAFASATLCWSYEALSEGVSGIFHHTPGEWYWTGFISAIMLFSPTILTIKYWGTLTWRKASSPRNVA